MAVGRRVRPPGRPGGLAEDYPIGSALAGQCDARIDQGRVQRTVVVGLSAIGAVVVGAHVTHIAGSHANLGVDNGHIGLHTSNVTSGNFSGWQRSSGVGKETPMANTRVLVTGATGRIGGAVAAQLLEKGVATRALVHREDGRSARLRALGAELVMADMFDIQQVQSALDG